MKILIAALMLSFVFASSANALVIRALFKNVSCKVSYAADPYNPRTSVSVAIDSKTVYYQTFGSGSTEEYSNALQAYCDSVINAANNVGEKSSVTNYLLVDTAAKAEDGSFLVNEPNKNICEKK